MTEKELLEKISASAQEEKIPQSLDPDEIKKKLQAKKSQKKAHSRNYYGKVIAAGIALCLCVAGGLQVVRIRQQNSSQEMDTAAENVAESSAADGSTADTSTADISTVGTSAGIAAEKTNAGDLYVVAKDYGEVYDALETAENTQWKYTEEAAGETASGTGIAGVDEGTDSTYVVSEDQEGGISNESAMEDTVNPNMVSQSDVDTAVGAAEDFKGAKEESASGETSHSTTNLMTEGVDESDIVKTDGAYIYTVSGNTIMITDIQNGALKKVGETTIEVSQASDSILEMYVNGSILNVIIQRENTNLQKDTTTKANTNTNAKINIKTAEEPVSDDVYYFSSEVQTELLTYDISNPAKPVLSGSMAQDGYYNTSRKIGDIVYLFTNKSVSLPVTTREEAVTEDNIGGWIPVVGGKMVAADCIYVGDNGSEGLVISSTDVKNPDQIVDNTLILNNYVDIYVSTKAVYLYQQNYSGNSSTTDIAKFSLNKGMINAVGAVSAKGMVLDSFAINENAGKLRLFTTSDDTITGDRVNNLYLFDEKLKLTGKIEGMAQGEEIYAARYFGNMAYFVTYRNTDPLFAVDLSDEKNPKVVGELKISGFSEYLHFWGKDKLVGIGYETDADTGEHLGIKLTMFDISSPANLKEIKSIVLKDVDYSEALYNYKCVLADADENMLGFVAQSYYEEESMSYVLFSWENGTFENLLAEKVDSTLGQSSYRGIYAGDTFYVVSSKGITSYNRQKEYKLMKKMEF